MRQDDEFNNYPVFDPWEPVGSAAQLAGCSMLVFAVAFVLLPWALTGRRPNPVTGAVLGVAVLVQVAVGVATLRSGLSGAVVEPILGALTVGAWFYVPFGLLVWFTFGARGWTQAATISLILANPLTGLFSYYNGSFDARPWYEAITAMFTLVAGVCFLVAATSRTQVRTPITRGTKPPLATRNV